MDINQVYKTGVDYKYASKIFEDAATVRNATLTHTYSSIAKSDWMENVVQSVRDKGVDMLPKPILQDDLRAQKNFIQEAFRFRSGRLSPSAVPAGGLNGLLAEKRITFDDCASPTEFRARMAQVASISVKNPLIDNLELVRICADPCLTNIASRLLGAPAALTWVKMGRSLPNFSEAFNTQQFHIDRGSIRTIKFLIFLNDPSLSCGFFKYWKESHLDGKLWWDKSIRLTEQSLTDFYGVDRLSKLGKSAFDIVVADTIGVHAGCVPRDFHRDVLIISYGLHKEFALDGSQDACPVVQRKLIDNLARDTNGIFDLCHIQ